MAALITSLFEDIKELEPHFRRPIPAEGSVEMFKCLLSGFEDGDRYTFLAHLLVTKGKSLTYKAMLAANFMVHEILSFV